MSARASAEAYPRPAVAWYGVVLLALMYALMMADRQLLAVLTIPIQASLALTDIELALLQGVAFALVYGFASLLAGRIVDRFDRRVLIFCGVLVWSVACAATSLASAFWTLFLCRMMLGVGDGALLPGATSLVSDLLPRRRLTLGMGVFAAGASVGIGVALVGGGWLFDHLSARSFAYLPVVGGMEPWQLVFLIVGAPGGLVALLLFTLPEPPRVGRGANGPAAGAYSRFVKSNLRLVTAHHIGFSFNLLIAYAVMAWTPAYLSRRFQWSFTEIGGWLGLVLFVTGVIAPLASGMIANRAYARGNLDIHFRLLLLTKALVLPAAALAYSAPSAELCVLGVGLVSLLNTAGTPLSSAALQFMAPNELRGRLSGGYVFFSGIVGAGGGPLLVAWITEGLLQDRAQVGLALLWVVGGCALAGAAAAAWGLRDYRAAVTRTESLYGSPLATASGPRATDSPSVTVTLPRV